MGKHSTAKLFFIFAAWALLAVAAVAAVAAVIIFLRFRSIRTQAEADAAGLASSGLTSVLEREASDLSGPALSSFTNAAGELLSDQVRTIRLWSSAGELLAAAGDDQAARADAEALARAVEGEPAAFKTGSPDGAVLVSYAALGSGAVLELQQDYGPIAESVAAGQRELLLFTGAGGAALALLIPLIVWAATRGLKREYNRLLYLYRTGQAIRSTLDLTGVLEQVARDVALFTRVPLAVTTLVEETSNDLLVKASFDRQANTTTQHHRRVEEWFMRRCAATGETVQAQQDSLPYASLLGYEPKLQGPVSFVCAAIPGRERAIGVVTVVRSRGQGAFSASDVRMIEEMAAQAAMAVEQAVLFAKVRTYADEVELSYDSTLRVLMAALDTKDAATQGHSERVSRLTLALAKEMGLPKERLLHIERGALLHDVGKIGVPDAVLGKPDSLNEREWEAMQKHPLLAGLMVSKVGFLEEALPILLYHHERYDGTGYPFGLEGKAIPLEARIFAVVDAYDAMTSDRPYRNAMPPDVAVREIERQANSQFDPQVVEAFTQVMAREQARARRAA